MVHRRGWNVWGVGSSFAPERCLQRPGVLGVQCGGFGELWTSPHCCRVTARFPPLGPCSSHCRGSITARVILHQYRSGSASSPSRSLSQVERGGFGSIGTEDRGQDGPVCYFVASLRVAQIWTKVYKGRSLSIEPGPGACVKGSSVELITLFVTLILPSCPLFAVRFAGQQEQLALRWSAASDAGAWGGRWRS